MKDLRQLIIAASSAFIVAHGATSAAPPVTVDNIAGKVDGALREHDTRALYLLVRQVSSHPDSKAGSDDSQRLALFIALRKGLAARIDQTFDAWKEMAVIDMTPPDSKYQSGTRPEDVHEPETRRLFEIALAENSKRAERANEQISLRRLSDDADRYIVRTFASVNRYADLDLELLQNQLGDLPESEQLLLEIQNLANEQTQSRIQSRPLYP